MVKFSSDCLAKMKELTQELELELGPGTGELTMRFGLHSGPVTAGVLRGEKSRFQLFGDTVNTGKSGTLPFAFWCSLRRNTHCSICLQLRGWKAQGNGKL